MPQPCDNKGFDDASSLLRFFPDPAPSDSRDRRQSYAQLTGVCKRCVCVAFKSKVTELPHALWDINIDCPKGRDLRFVDGYPPSSPNKIWNLGMSSVNICSRDRYVAFTCMVLCVSLRIEENICPDYRPGSTEHTCTLLSPSCGPGTCVFMSSSPVVREHAGVLCRSSLTEALRSEVSCPASPLSEGRSQAGFQPPDLPSSRALDTCDLSRVP